MMESLAEGLMVKKEIRVSEVKFTLGFGFRGKQNYRKHSCSARRSSQDPR